ncbi:helix-turn-helix transcriptional regulator [Methylobacterium sp. WL103]|uniref:helix-turn-helix transcriptional regulator n=1 Tax=Methylobacterium sp. WL103 TaxID=2603891 RepID=UPI0011C91EB7|nr:helix-turn-helix transcriptional regulator [Methylobacterium sp. WL103]TXN07943.1 helix-turn-helix transcriptional regulator [Methylobacterium sp. WL103]
MAEFLRRRIDELSSRKSQREIALEAGYEKPNILSMFKRGETKVPFDKVPALADALEVDPNHLLRLQMEQPGGYDPKVIDKMLGQITTSGERKVIAALREANEGHDLDLGDKEVRELADSYRKILTKRAAAKKVAQSA